METEAALITTAEEAVAAMASREEAMEAAVVVTSVADTEAIEEAVATNAEATVVAIEVATEEIEEAAADMEEIEEVTVVAKEVLPSVTTRILASLATSVSTLISVKLR